MKVKKYFFLFILSFVFTNTQAQDDNKFQKRNAMLLELGGSSYIYSLNYERFIINNESLKTSLQFGAGYFPYLHGDIWIPFGINQLYSLKNSHIELGIGYVAVRESILDETPAIVGKRWIDQLYGRIGYRYQKPEGRLFFRIGFTPLLRRERISYDYYNPDAPFNAFFPWGGVSVGYSL